MTNGQERLHVDLKIVSALVLFLPLLLSACESSEAEAPSGNWRNDTCIAVAEKRVEELDLDRLVVKKIEYVDKRTRVGHRVRITGYEAWVTFEKCEGNLILGMNKSCHVINRYATRECKKVIDL